MKRIVSIALTLILLCTLTLTAFAAETPAITVNGTQPGATYTLYKLLDLPAYSGDNYFYTVNSAWAGFFATDDAKAYVSVDAEDGHVEWIAETTDTVKAAFAQKALAYAKANNIASVASYTNSSEEVATYVFSDLELGYYLLDSSIGVLCNLTTVAPTAVISPKSTVPTIDKETEDTSASIGDIVDFTVTITVGDGAEKYVLHDKMTDGLTFVHDVDNNRGVLSVTLADVALVEGTDYTVKTTGFDVNHACTFEVIFTETGMAKMDKGEILIVSYNAQVNANAIDNSAENAAQLQYGDNMTTEITPTDKTETKTYSIDLVKTDDSGELLPGAQFRLYDAATGGNEIPVVKVSDGVYRLAMPDEQGEAIVVANGKVTVYGFGNGTYYLEETVAPAGYNMLTARKEFTIADKNLSASFNDGKYDKDGVQVVNKTGTLLPETGAEGTILFVAIGVVVVLAAGVLLVTKKRMSMIQD